MTKVSSVSKEERGLFLENFPYLPQMLPQEPMPPRGWSMDYLQRKAGIWVQYYLVVMKGAF